MTRRPIVGVMGSGIRAWRERSEPLGRWLAACGCHLLTGGGGGVMTAVSRAFFETTDRRGLVLGVLPAAGDDCGRPPADDCGRSPAGYPSPWVEVAIRTHLALSGAQGTSSASRNHINVLTSDVLVFLPGSAGTRSELELAVRYRRPAVVWAEDLDISDTAAAAAGETSLTVARSLDDVQRFVRATLGEATSL